MSEKKLYIGGQWVPSQGSDWIEVENPASQEIIDRVPAGHAEDVNKAVEAAKKALPAWSGLAPEKREAYVKDMVAHLEASFDDLNEVLAAELGSPPKKTKARHLSSYMGSMEGFISHHRDLEYRIERDGYYLLREPVGVVACLTPWNYPFGQIVKKVIPALLTGNTLILKPSKSTPLSAYVWAEAADKAGLPPGVFNLVTGRGAQVGNVLATHPDVNMVHFTGSTQGGKDLAQLALSSTTKRLVLEMGGKSAGIIMEGADLDQALKSILGTVYSNVGQTCSAITRVLVPESIKEEVEEKIVEKTKTYTFGNPLEDPDVYAGVLNSQAQFDKVRSYVKLGQEEGARILYGQVPEEGRGYEVGPVIFTDVKNDMRIAQEEIFGPVTCLITYKDLDEAIEIANDSIYGLSGMVFAKTDQEALEVAKRMDTGQVIINQGDRHMNAPFGGHKESGIGREGALEGLEEFLEYKTIFI